VLAIFTVQLRQTLLFDYRLIAWRQWNGDVTNDIFREEQIVGQFLSPAGRAYATSIPVMLARGNHDVRGREAPYLQDYLTGPNGAYHFGFRQGPLACLVMDTGEDKPDDHVEYGGLADFSSYRTMQAAWLERVIDEDWFKEAPFRVAFMHIPLVWDGTSRFREWDGECIGWICEDGPPKKKQRQIVPTLGHMHAVLRARRDELVAEPEEGQVVVVRGVRGAQEHEMTRVPVAPG
jgi:hypothetical protein